MIFNGPRYVVLCVLVLLTAGMSNCAKENAEVTKRFQEDTERARMEALGERQEKHQLGPTPDKSAPFGVYIPKNLDDAFVELKKMSDPSVLSEFKQAKEADLAKYHMGIGLWMRNNWGLWKGSHLADHFRSLGIFHPDDMSGIIITSFYRHLNGKPIRLDEQVERYKAYWNSPEMLASMEQERLRALREREKREERERATPEQLLILEAKRGDNAAVRRLLDQGVDVNAKNADGWSALIFMAGWGETGLVQMLLDKGAAVNAQLASGRTALMAAAEGGHTSVLQALLDRGADVNTKAVDGRTALMLAARDGEITAVQALMKQGADVKDKALDGWTALMFAASFGNAEVLQALLEKSDVAAETPEGLTALKAAAAAGHVKEVELLKRAGAKN